MKLDIISKFLYKLLFLTCILLVSVVLERFSIINLNIIKDHLNKNVNLIQITKKVNGDLNILDLDDNVINVSLNDTFMEKISENKYKYYKKTSKVLSSTLGSVIKIEEDKSNKLFTVTILDENNNLVIYSHLIKTEVKLYQIVKTNDVIGVANKIDNNINNEYNYYYLLTINEN